MNKSAGDRADAVGALAGGPLYLDGRWASVMAATTTVRVIVAVCGTALVWALPGHAGGRHLTYLTLVAAVYLPYCFVARAVLSRPGAGIRFPLAAGDLLIVFAFAVFVPPTATVAAFGFLTLVAFYSAAEGARMGITVGATSIALLYIAKTLAPADGLSTYTLSMFPAVVLSLAIVLAAAARHARSLERQFAHQATHDPLTGLPNRVLLLDRLGVALDRARRKPGLVGVLFLDLDDFKVVNDSLGHAAGDSILTAVAQRLADALRPGDTVARFGGDEFVVLCEELSGHEHGRAIAQRLLEALAPPLHLPAGQIHVQACVGIAFAESASPAADDLLRDADAAMYRAKERGRGEVALFDAGVRGQAVARLETETALRVALERDELELHYQPGVDLETGKVVAVEALLRWRHPTRGLLTPSEFLAVAERTGLIVPIGKWVLEEACTQLSEWRRAMPDVAPLGVSVNVAIQQLRSPGFVSTVKAALSRADLNPWHLYIEVTEDALMDEGRSLVALQQTADLGVLTGVDDFGIGYSSLGRLRQLPVCFLKLDRSFISGEGERAGDPALLAAVTELARAMGMPAVAEGPETLEQLALLRNAGFRYAQGNCFGVAQPPDAIADSFRRPLPALVVTLP